MNYLEKNLEAFKEDLKGLIKFDTVLKIKEEWPTQEMKDALSYMKSLADRDGMKSYINEDGYYGYIEIGQGKEMIGILAHVDVVSPGDVNEWKYDPFDLTIEGDIWYARGTQDDKGPLMLSYYLLKELKDKPLNKRIRLIFPTDEESYWRGIEKYNELEEKPTFGWTPDSTFPVTFLERESVGLKITGPSFEEGVIEGGVSINAVPAKASITIGDTEDIYEGKAAHAMDPSKGINAISRLISNTEGIDHPLINFYKENIGMEYNGESMFDKIIKDDYATQTLNVGIIKMNNEESMFTIDMRIPTTETADNLQKIITDKASKYGLGVERVKHHDLLMVDKDSKLVKTLMNVYNEYTLENKEPVHTGGGTYARAMKNTVAFGPMFEHDEFTEHQVNERLNIKNFIKSYDIYLNVLKELA